MCDANCHASELPLSAVCDVDGSVTSLSDGGACVCQETQCRVMIGGNCRKPEP